MILLYDVIFNEYVANPSLNLSGRPENLSSLFYTAWQCLGEPKDIGFIGERLFTDETCLKNRALDAVRLRALSILACKHPDERVNLKLQLWLESGSPDEKREEAAGLLRDYLRSPTGELSLAGLGLTSLPDIFDEVGFAGITYLDVDGNKLSSLPETIGDLSQLETLVVTHNCLTELPESLGRCRELRYLLCGYNQITSIPAGVVSLIPTMFIVNFAFNRLTTLPPGRAETQTSYEGNPILELVLQGMMRGLFEIQAAPKQAFKYFKAFHKVCFDLPCGTALFHSVWVDAGSSHADPQFGEKAFLEQGGLSMSNEKRIKLLQEVLSPYVRENPAIFNMPMKEIENIMPLQTFFPSLKIIGKEVWEYCLADCGGLKASGLSINEKRVPSHDKIIPILRQLSQHAVEENMGLTLLTVPQGLSIEKLEKLFRGRCAYLGGNMPVNFTLMEWDEVKETRFIVMTNGIFEGSRNKTPEEHITFVQEKGCTLPEIVPLFALLLLTEKSSEPHLRLFGNNPTTYTRCKETYLGFSLIVGDFSPSGIQVYTSDEADPSDGAGGAIEVLSLGL